MESKISLSLFIQGANMLSSQECDKNPKENYEKHKMFITDSDKKGKHQKESKIPIIFYTRKQKLITQNINICKEAYDYMLSTPTSNKLAKPLKVNKSGEVVKRVWDTLTIHERLKKHFDLIANDFRAASYSYEILDD